MNSTYISTNTWAPRISREQARRFPCPKCGAAAGQLCKNEGGGFRRVNHTERAKAIRQAHLTKVKAAVDAIPAEAWNYAGAYLENLGRSMTITGLTPAEEEIGNRALTSMAFGRQLLVKHHAGRKSLSDIATEWGKSENSVHRSYDDARTHLASHLTPLMSASCAVCREQMPEIVTNQCLRCPDCRRILENLWCRRAPQFLLPSPSDKAKLLESCAVLMVPYNASIDIIKQARDEQLQRLAWVMDMDVPAHVKQIVETARTAINEAWECIQRHHTL